MKISVIIPAYKSQFLNEAISSVVNQTYSDWELVIVDDCSPEDIHNIVIPYLSDSRIRYYRNKSNCGAINLVDNWNICLSYCTGDYIICMGDDDVLFPYCLEEYTRCIRKYPDVEVFYGETIIIDQHSLKIRNTKKHPEWESINEFLYNLWRGRDLFIGDVLIKTSRLKEIGGYVKYPLAWGSDHITTILAGERHGIVSTEKVVFQYRQHIGTLSLSKSQLEPKLLADEEVFDWYNHFINKQLKNGEAPTETIKKLQMLYPRQKRYRIAWDLSESYILHPFCLIKAYARIYKSNKDIWTLYLSLYYSIMRGLHLVR